MMPRHPTPRPAQIGGIEVAAAGYGALMDDALATAGLGTWLVDLRTREIRWSRVTRFIHEVALDYLPELSAALNFYEPQSREIIGTAVTQGMDNGKPWDLDLKLVTARGRHIWVRTSGRALLQDGAATHLVGTITDITDRRAAAEENRRLSLVVRQMSNAAIITDAEGRTEWVNEGFRRLTGYGLEDVRGQSAADMLRGPNSSGVARQAIRDAVRDGTHIVTEILNYGRDGLPIWLSMDIRPIRLEDGTVSGFIAIATDLTDRRLAEESAQAEIIRRTNAERLLRDLMDATPNAVIAYDRDERVIFFNSTYRTMFPLMMEKMRLGAGLEDIIRHGIARGQYPDAGHTPESQATWLADCLAAHRNPGPSRELMLPDATWLQLRERRSANGHLVCTRTDITRLKAAEEQARRQSEQDALTGLSNRAVLFRQLDALTIGRRHGDVPAACLLLFDLDHFKATNDTLGHPAGDALLCEIASRGRALLRREDTFVRLGGDEFGILLPGVTTSAQATVVIGKLRARMEEPLPFGGSSITPSLSIGVALFPSDASDTDSLFRSADTALYQAKRLGRHCHSFFDRSIAAALERKAQLAEELRRAIAREDLAVALQPQVSVRDRAHVGFEALARWSEAAAPVPPSEFIPVAEEMGLIRGLGELVLRRALQAMRDLLDQGLEPGRVAVNVATAQLLSDDFPKQVRVALQRCALPAHRLEIELTETTLLDRSSERIVQVLRELKALGVGIALDDFGTGYASLSHLTQFPVDRLKIDRRFIRGIGADATPSPIARTVIGLAHGLGLEVVAEGVETEAQFSYLAEHGCDIVQGYLTGKPLDMAAAARHLGGVGQRRPITAG